MVRVLRAVARRQGQWTLVLVLLPTTLKTAGCTAWSLALLVPSTRSSRSRSVPPCRGGAIRPWRPFEVLEVWNRPRYASTAPVALVRGYCVTPGFRGFPVGPNRRGRPSHDCSCRPDGTWDSPVHDPRSRGGPRGPTCSHRGHALAREGDGP